MIIDDLSDDRAKEIGVTIGQITRSDIADTHVALLAAERSHAVLTSDDADIAAVNPELTIIHI